MARLLPIFLFLFGTGAGIGAGLVIPQTEPDASETTIDGGSPDGQDPSETASGEDHASAASKPGHEAVAAGHADTAADEHGSDVYDYVKMNNQFVVPVVAAQRVEALVVISLSIEAEPALRDQIYAREPKVRDAFLQVLFDHSNMGGFQGAFTRASNLEILRTALTDVAKAEFGPGIRSVLIVDIARQDV